MNTVAPAQYSDYGQVPFFRRQWFFWIMWIIFAPVALFILATGDVYFVKKGEVTSFGMSNRVIASILAFFWSYSWLHYLFSARPTS